MGGLAPGAPPPDSDVQGDRELGRPAHLILEEGFDGSGFPGRDLNQEFVVDLKEDAASEPLLIERTVDVDHGLFDDVGRAALDGGVEGRPLGHFTTLTVVAGEVGQVAATAEHRLGVAIATRLLHHGLQIVVNPFLRSAASALSMPS